MVRRAHSQTRGVRRSPTLSSRVLERDIEVERGGDAVPQISLQLIRIFDDAPIVCSAAHATHALRLKAKNPESFIALSNRPPLNLKFDLYRFMR